MAQVFISHSSRDKALINKFVDLLETGLGVRGKNTIFASSIPGKDIEMGNVDSTVREKLVGAELAIFILSHNFYASTYCMNEMGAAWGTERPTFVLTAPSLGPNDARAVFSGIQIERLQASQSLDKLAEVVANSGVDRDDPGVSRWSEKRDEFLAWLGSDYEETSPKALSRIEDLPRWRDRGHWSESIVDGTLYIGSGYVNMDVKKEIFKAIKRGHVLPTIYSYMTNAGYHNWVRLTEDPSYQYYHDSLGLLTEHSQIFAEKIKGAVDGESEIDLISLGPGDGKKDTVMLKALAKVFAPSSLYYYPFDVNPSMISHAMTATRGVRPTLEDIQVKAILADFDSLPEFSNIYQYRAAPNVLTLVGNTLGNVPDDRGFLEQLHGKAMSKGDLLLLEVRKVSDSNLRTEANKEFDFGPLELLGIRFASKKLDYEETDRYSPVPKTRTTMATYEEMTYEGKAYKDVKLALIREYDPTALKATCEKIGFEIVAQDEHKSAVSFLLKKM